MIFKIILLYFIIIYIWNIDAFLIFPPTAPTRIQFIGGVGIPVEDLLYESVTSGYVLKAEYFLPTKAEEFTTIYLRPQNIARSLNQSLTYANQIIHNNTHLFNDHFHNQQNNVATYRWILYKAVEMALDRAGLKGQACLLHSICEHAALPLHYESGMFAEIAHILLSPTSSKDMEDSQNLHKKYIEAEIIGRNGKNCSSIYKECINSPINQFTAIFDIFH